MKLTRRQFIKLSLVEIGSLHIIGCNNKTEDNRESVNITTPSPLVETDSSNNLIIASEVTQTNTASTTTPIEWYSGDFVKWNESEQMEWL